MTNEIALLTALKNGATINPAFQPQNNKQAYLAYLNGLEIDLPEPRTAEEVLLYALCVNGTGGGGGSVEVGIKTADYLFYRDRVTHYGTLASLLDAPTSAEDMFLEAEGVTEVDLSLIDFSQCEEFSEMFNRAKLTRIDVSSVDMSNIKSGGANYMFRACEAEEIIGIGCNANVNYNFRDFLLDISTSLRRLTFSPKIKGMNQTIDIANCSFDRAGMVEMFNSLPSGCTSTIIITGNPCVVDGTLTEADKAIATNKGCTLEV